MSAARQKNKGWDRYIFVITANPLIAQAVRVCLRPKGPRKSLGREENDVGVGSTLSSPHPRLEGLYAG